jgi:hypothetical protein
MADESAAGIADEPPDPTNPNGIDTVDELAEGAGGGGNVGTTIPGGGAATARGSSISSRGRSGKAS